jgi:hypothetical protein
LYDMSRIVQARIDERTERVLADLRRRTGLTDSELVRRGLLALSRDQPRKLTKRIRGMGKFASGRSDLATAPDALEGFGGS